MNPSLRAGRGEKYTPRPYIITLHYFTSFYINIILHHHHLSPRAGVSNQLQRLGVQAEVFCEEFVQTEL